MSGVFQAGFGARLKDAREAKNLALADVAAKLKLTSRQVEALEEEDLSHLPSEVFVRGFVRNYARLVDLDPASLIAPVNVQAEVSEIITAPNAGLVVGSSSIRLWVIYPLIAMAVFLILVAALYHWLRQGEDSLISTPPELATQSLSPAPSVPVVPPTPVPEPTPPAVDTSVTTPLTLPGASMPLVSNATEPQNEVPATAVAPAAVKPVVPEAPVAPSNADTNVKSGARSMRFEPAQDAWIQVVDGKGTRFSRLVRAGTAESFSGEPPFRLVVGEAALVKLTYNGHSIDLMPFIGQKVARLTLE